MVLDNLRSLEGPIDEDMIDALRFFATVRDPRSLEPLHALRERSDLAPFARLIDIAVRRQEIVPS
jgi:hypothetical protein